MCVLMLLIGCAEQPGEPDAQDTGVASLAAAEDAPPALGPAKVRLGPRSDPAAAAHYALLASTAITNVTGTYIGRGNVGLSPSAASFITGFTLTADASNTFATSPSVAGRVYAANFAPPTPSNLTRAVGSMEWAYTDAAGRVQPDFLNLQSGDLGGLTLAPGLYRWGSTVTIPHDVTISGGPRDVWIFQISDDLDVSASQRVILSGGARARNIFWQVAGQVTLHAGAHMEGNLLSKTAVTLQTGASLHGRALAQSQIALDDNQVNVR